MMDESIAPDSNTSGDDRETSRLIVIGPGLENDPGIYVPASMLTRIKDDAWAWYSIITTVQFFALDLEEAKKEGFELLPDETTSQCLILHSQFRIYATYVQKDLKKELYLAYPQDIQEIKKIPVILASSLGRSKEETSFTSKRFLPPAEHGTVGIVVSDGELYFYTIDMLSKAIQERQKHISALLEELEEHYAGEFVGTLGDPNTALFNQDEEVRDMVQQLAQDYYQHHQSLQAQDKKKRVRRIPTAIEAKGNECINIRSDMLGVKILYALRSKEDYIKVKGHDIALYRHEFDVTLREKGHVQKEQAQLMITIEPQKDEGWETILTALNTLGDGCMDTFTALMAIAIDRNGVDKMRMPFEISPDDILAVCKKEKSKGSYKISQKAEIVAHLKTLSQAHVIATIPTVITRKRKGKDVTEKTIIKAEGAILDLLSFKIGEYSTITGEEIWEKREVSIGAWAEMMPGINASTATMLRQVLAYKAKNQRYQKRIGRYLTLMFRFNARRGGSFPNGISMGALLTGAGIEPPRQQGEFKEAVEHALEDLKRDNVIGDYWRIIEETPEAIEIDRRVEERARGWFDYYLKQMWNFKPPVILQEQYKNLLKKASEDGSDSNQS